MDKPEIAAFLKASIEPLPDTFDGNRYRAAARLIDGTYLPCVIFQSRQRRVELALKRFEQERAKPDQYRMVVESFVSNSSIVADYEIMSVEASPFAWPRNILEMIHGETMMGWTAFVVEMNDGNRFSYGTSFDFDFFDLPDGYTFNNIKQIHSGVIHLDIEGTVPFSDEADERAKYFREKPSFTCYMDEIAP